MTPDDVLRLALALGFVLLNGWFVLAEFALVKVRTTRLRELSQGGSGNAAMALRITGKLDQYLSAIQLGITLASLALGWIGEPALAHLAEPVVRGLAASFSPGAQGALIHGLAFGVAFTTITFLHVVLGEMAPKSLAILQAERFALWVAWPLHVFYLVTAPIIWLLQGSSNVLLRLLRFEPGSEGADPYTEEELRMIVAASHHHGVLDESTRYLLDNVLDYTTRRTREVMTHRRDAQWLDVRLPVQEAMTIALDREFSRYLLMDPEKDQVLGIVHVKDLAAVATGRRAIRTLRELARPALFVPEFVPADRTRRLLQAKRTHMAVVVDELGEWVGIVTLEDLLEELVGEIQDEQDVEQPKVQRRPDGSLEVDGGLLLGAAVKQLGLEPPDGEVEADTLGGWVFGRLGRAPHVGDAVQQGRHRLEVLQTDRLRIKRLRVLLSAEPLPSGDAAAAASTTAAPAPLAAPTPPAGVPTAGTSSGRRPRPPTDVGPPPGGPA